MSEHRKHHIERQPKKCVFCGGSRMSKEHIWSDWMGIHFHNQKEHFHFLTNIQLNSGDRTILLTPLIDRRSGPLHKRKIRNVCQTCNNGWMSRIVERAKPWVEPAILGKHVEFNSASQSAFASWAALTVVMAEYTDPANMGVPASDREHLMVSGGSTRVVDDCGRTLRGTGVETPLLPAPW